MTDWEDPTPDELADEFSDPELVDELEKLVGKDAVAKARQLILQHRAAPPFHVERFCYVVDPKSEPFIGTKTFTLELEKARIPLRLMVANDENAQHFSVDAISFDGISPLAVAPIPASVFATPLDSEGAQIGQLDCRPRYTIRLAVTNHGARVYRWAWVRRLMKSHHWFWAKRLGRWLTRAIRRFTPSDFVHQPMPFLASWICEERR